MALLTEEKIQRVKNMLVSGTSQNQTAKQLRMSKTSVANIAHGKYGPVVAGDTSQATSVLSGCGMKLEDAVIKHDTPARIKDHLDKIIEFFPNDAIYEEAEIKRLCKVAVGDNEYWEQITSEPQYAKYNGYTEKGVRVWGSEKALIEFSKMTTGFELGVNHA